MLPVLKIGFFGQSGPFAPPALRGLLSHFDSATKLPWEVVMVVEGRRKPMGRHKHRWHMPSVRGFTKPTLPKGQGLPELALAAGIPVFQTCDINSAYAVSELSKLPFDLLLCVGFDRLFKPNILALPKRGAWNCHPSTLPELRGPAPIFWALKRGDTSIGMTIHRVDAEEDHGHILHQGSIPFPELASGSEIYEMAGEWVGREVHTLLHHELNQTLRSVEQDHFQASRAPRAKAEDVCVVPREWSCHHLLRFACGAPYFRAPWLRMGEETFYLRRGLRVVPGRKLPAQYVLSGSELIVSCSDGVVHLEIQT